MKFNKPTLVTITAPTCSGKTYLMNRLMEMGYPQIVSTTTRAPREGEVNGVDYWFIKREESRALEINGDYAELIEFRGNFYGTTHAELNRKIYGDMPPLLILETKGLSAYEKICLDNEWNIFKIYVTTPEPVRIQRLNQRTAEDIRAAVKKFHDEHVDTCWGLTVQFDHHKNVEQDVINKIIETHTSRLLSITGDERLWQSQHTWDAIVPGDDIEKALSFIEQGIKWQNSRNVLPNT